MLRLPYAGFLCMHYTDIIISTNNKALIYADTHRNIMYYICCTDIYIGNTSVSRECLDKINLF